ncbi:MAG: YkgJ family cysteine cluster protein [Cellulosilyticaceae bacterium]
MRTLKTLEGISDGKLYDYDDIVNADTRGCNGCYTCCHQIGDLVELTPFDVYEMTTYLNETFDMLCDKKIALQKNNKLMLPYLKMVGERQQCSFLNEKGRCSIHGQRPNICRLFPLGRVYENDNFKYFLQVGTCVMNDLSPIKVSDWIGIKDYDENKKFIIEWYKLLKALQFRLKFVYDEEERCQLNDYLIKTFYNLDVKENETFYEAFIRILPEAKKQLGVL